MTRVMAALAALPLVAAVALMPAAALANGVPTLVTLTYLDDLSNWGPTDATGELELSFAEGYARLQATGLPRLDGELYQGWLVNSESNDAISTGRFNADTIGSVTYEGTLPPISDFGFDLFLITVEPEPDDAPQPGGNRSIGGRFSLLGDATADGSTPGDVTGDASAQPGQLPDTGAPPFSGDVARFSLLLAAIALSAFIGLRLGRRHT